MLYTEISQKIQDEDILIYHQLYFYKNETSKKEIDVIIQQDGKVVPIEVKSGNTRANSLKSLMRKNKDICLGYKFVDGNIGVSEDGIITLPLYMIVFIKKITVFTDVGAVVVYMTVHFLTGLNFCPSDKSLLRESLYTSGLA